MSKTAHHALVEALNAVISATRAYLPPDGIDANECLNRILAATDNPRVLAALAEASATTVVTEP